MNPFDEDEEIIESFDPFEDCRIDEVGVIYDPEPEAQPFTQQKYFTVVHNIVIDQLMRELSSNSFKVLLVIIRKTVGYHKEKDAISYSQMREITGIKSNDTIIKAIRELEEKDIVIKTIRQNKRNPKMQPPNIYQLNQELKIKIKSQNRGGSLKIRQGSLKIRHTKESTLIVRTISYMYLSTYYKIANMKGLQLLRYKHLQRN